MVAALYQTLKNNIETELSVNYQKKKEKVTSIQAMPLKKVFYRTGVCKLLF